MSDYPNASAATTCIDAGRCLCGEWVSTPHRDCIALAEEHIRPRTEEPENGRSGGDS